MRERALALRAEGLTYRQIAERLAAEFNLEAAITASAVAALIRRKATEPGKTQRDAGLSPRTVRYIHTIVHAAFKDALRSNRIVRNPADAATPPSASAARSARPQACTADQLRGFLAFAADDLW